MYTPTADRSNPGSAPTSVSAATKTVFGVVSPSKVRGCSRAMLRPSDE
jgi:hypothetical protein